MPVKKEVFESTDGKIMSSEYTSDSDIVDSDGNVGSNSNVKANHSLALIVKPKTLFEKWQ